jgi:hypothetical protein
MANIAPDRVLRAVRAARKENGSIRSYQEILESRFCLQRHIAAGHMRIYGISQNPTFSIEYKKSRQLSSRVFLLYGISEQGNKSKVLFLLNGSLHKVKFCYMFHHISD